MFERSETSALKINSAVRGTSSELIFVPKERIGELIVKIGLVKTYFCNECNRHTYPMDIYIRWRDESLNHLDRDEDHIVVTYSCACNEKMIAVKYEVDENNELVPAHNGYRRLW